MSRAIDADALEKDGWMMHRTVQVDKDTMSYQTKKPTDFPTIESKLLKQLKILATVLDGCPLTEACDKLFDLDRYWCRQHCKPGQDVADAECWMKYAEAMKNV